MNEPTKRERKQRMDIANEGDTPKQRIPLTKKGRLGFPPSVEKLEDMHYCWAMDDDEGNVLRYQESDYEIALDKNKNEVRVKSGNGFDLVLMKIKKEYYEEDLAITNKEAQDAMRREGLGDNEYLPMDRRDVVTRTVQR